MSSNDDNSTYVSPGNGISGGYTGNDTNIKRAMMCFTAIAWYNSIEIIILLFVVFKRYKGLYFWSVLITAIAIIVYSFGAWGKLVSVSRYDFFPVTFTTMGWVVMVTGQSIVLWSRLHLITQNERLLKGILYGIIINSFVMCTPTVVLTYGSNASSPAEYISGYQVMEKIQMTAFSVQELFISCVYLYEVRKLLKVIYDAPARKLMWELVAINVAIIILDTALLTVEFVNLYQIEITLKGMIYSIKLKLEFGVLSKLVKIITKRHDSAGTVLDTSEDGKAEAAVTPASDLAQLAPAYTRDTTRSSMMTGTTLGCAESTGYSAESRAASSKKSGTSISYGHRWASHGSGRGVTAMEVLRDDFAFRSPTVMSGCVGEEDDHEPVSPGHGRLHQHMPLDTGSRRSSMDDYYPGRLV